MAGIPGRVRYPVQRLRGQGGKTRGAPGPQLRAAPGSANASTSGLGASSWRPGRDSSCDWPVGRRAGLGGRRARVVQRARLERGGDLEGSSHAHFGTP